MIDPDDITRSQICQTQKDKYHVIPLTQGTQDREIHRDRKSIRSDQGLRKERVESCCLMVTGFLFEIMKKS